MHGGPLLLRRFWQNPWSQLQLRIPADCVCLLLTEQGTKAIKYNKIGSLFKHEHSRLIKHGPVESTAQHNAAQESDTHVQSVMYSTDLSCSPLALQFAVEPMLANPQYSNMVLQSRHHESHLEQHNPNTCHHRLTTTAPSIKCLFYQS